MAAACDEQRELPDPGLQRAHRQGLDLQALRASAAPSPTAAWSAPATCSSAAGAPAPGSASPACPRPSTPATQTRSRPAEQASKARRFGRRSKPNYLGGRTGTGLLGRDYARPGRSTGLSFRPASRAGRGYARTPASQGPYFPQLVVESGVKFLIASVQRSEK